ncbi:DNA-processing protein DprA [Aeromonas caviae]|uniref:DNA-processing protein DprA n=1 Tax=Aeromonas caviae TaxID=648 RepID=UPI0022589542|nr:DNA-processing protein DprA [Aeromonas caviae]MCX4031441.1 DNA-processing protein DprA [Aeromonas caviae]
MQALSPNTQAILLLTAPLIMGRSSSVTDLLTPGEYKNLARYLRDIRCQPSDLISPGAEEILQACQSVIDVSRLQRLLARGFLLSQVVERWQTRAIWVISRADPEYPRRLKARLREDAPAILYGCGDIGLLDAGGLAVVGSRNVTDDLVDYTMSIGQLAARAGRAIVSGGARGVDQAAMRGALKAGGKALGVLAEHLEKTSMSREERNYLRDGTLTLVSAYDPSAGFSIGHAMQRNKLIYALADTSLVVNSDFNKGGTWAGAVEQLDKFKFVPVFVRSTGEASTGLDGLKRKGALSWPDPQDVDSFQNVFNVTTPTTQQFGLSLLLSEEESSADTSPSALISHESAVVNQSEMASLRTIDIISDAQPYDVAVKEVLPKTQESMVPPAEAVMQPESTPAAELFATVRAVLEHLLKVPLKDTEVAAALDVSNVQAKAWLQRLVHEGVVEKRTRPSSYVLKKRQFFE